MDRLVCLRPGFIRRDTRHQSGLGIDRVSQLILRNVPGTDSVLSIENVVVNKHVVSSCG